MNNDPVPGMRVGTFMKDEKDYQGQQNWSWTGNLVTSTPSNMNPVPPTGDQYRQQLISGNGPQAGVDQRGYPVG